ESRRQKGSLLGRIPARARHRAVQAAPWKRKRRVRYVRARRGKPRGADVCPILHLPLPLCRALVLWMSCPQEKACSWTVRPAWGCIPLAHGALTVILRVMTQRNEIYRRVYRVARWAL